MGHISVRIAEPFGAVAAAVSEGVEGPGRAGRQVQEKCAISTGENQPFINYLFIQDSLKESPDSSLRGPKVPGP